MNIDARIENDQKGISRPDRIKAVINISQHKYLISYIETAEGNKSSELDSLNSSECLGGASLT